MRITKKHLEAKVSIVNVLLGFDTDGGANGGYNHKGFLTLSAVYGGYDVHQYVGESGGVNSLIGYHTTAKEASQFLSGMIAALRLESVDVALATLAGTSGMIAALRLESVDVALAALAGTDRYSVKDNDHNDQAREGEGGMSESPEQLFDPSDVTRVEIIDHRTGSSDVRAYQAHNCSVRLAVQDDGRTLKVFVGDNGRKSELRELVK